MQKRDKPWDKQWDKGKILSHGDEGRGTKKCACPALCPSRFFDRLSVEETEAKALRWLGPDALNPRDDVTLVQ